MLLYPAVSVKRLSETEAGELIQVSVYGTTALALVADADLQDKNLRRFLILFTAVEGRPAPPRFININGEQPAVLSYGKSYEFVIDHGAGMIDIGAQRRGRANGVIVVSGESALLRVGPLVQERWDYNSYNIQTGRIVEAPRTGDIALLTKWEIRLTESAAVRSPMQPLVRFALNPT